MTFNFKKALLAGTAIVAVSSFALVKTAAAADEFLVDADNSGTFTTTAPDETADTGLVWNSGSTGGAVTVANHDLNVVNTGTITFGASATVGDATTTTPGIIASVTGKTLTIDNTANNGAGETATVTGGISVGSGIAALNVVVTGEDTDNTGADTFTLAVNGDVNLGTGTLVLTADPGANANNDLFTSFTGNVTTGGITLNAAGSADNTIAFNGTTAQTVTGAIAGTAGTGATLIAVNNAAGVTFGGAVGTGTAIDSILIEKTAGNSSATFTGAVNAVAIQLGTDAHAGDVNTITFDGTTAGYTVAGTLQGSSAETDAVNVIGGHTIAQSGIWGGGGNLNTLSVTGAGTILDSNAAITLQTATIGAGATIDVGSGLLTSAVTNNGTLLLSGTGGVTGAIIGSGTLDVNETSTVTGAITQGSVTVATTKTLTATNNITAPVTLEGTGATLALSAAPHTVTGNVVTSGANGTGAVTVADNASTTAFVGDLGTSALKLATLNVAGAAANVVTTTGNLYVNAITANAADTLSFVGTGAQAVSGTITGGILSVGAGSTTTFASTLNSIASATVASGGTANFNGSTGISGGLVNNGTVGVNFGATVTGAITGAGTFNITRDTLLTANGGFNGTNTFNVDIGDNGDGTLTSVDLGGLSSTGAVNLAAETVNFNYVGEAIAGTTVFATGGAAATTAATVTDNSLLYNTSLVAATNNLNLVVTRNALVNIASTENGQNVGAVVDTLIGSTNPEIAAFNDRLATASTQGQIDDALESVTPTVDGGAVLGGFQASVQSLDVTQTRMASLRSGNETSMVGGSMGNGLNVWAQGFGQHADQDARNGVDGYKSNTLGGAVGIDTQNLADGATVGLALSYANSDVDSKNANNTNADVDSYQVSVYGDYNVAPQTYLSGTLGYAHNKIDQTRSDVGFAGNTAQADYDTDQFIAFAELGRDFEIAQNTTLTPSVLAHYQHISVDDYTETGAGGLNLDVNSNDLDVLEFGVGAELGWDLDGGNGSKIHPAINVGYRYDVIGDDVSTTSSFTGGGASFDTRGLEPAQSAFNVGASIGYAMDNNWELTADYDYQIKSDYDAHAGYVRAGYKF